MPCKCAIGPGTSQFRGPAPRCPFSDVWHSASRYPFRPKSIPCARKPDKPAICLTNRRARYQSKRTCGDEITTVEAINVDLRTSIWKGPLDPQPDVRIPKKRKPIRFNRVARHVERVSTFVSIHLMEDRLLRMECWDERPTYRREGRPCPPPR